MILPDAPLQRALYASCIATAALTDLVGMDGVHDFVPDRPAFPYVRIADGQTLDDEADGIDAAECFIDLHGFSREPGKMQAKALAAAMVLAGKADLAIDGHRLVEKTLEGVRTFTDPDGVTTHVVVSLRYLTEPTD